MPIRAERPAASDLLLATLEPWLAAWRFGAMLAISGVGLVLPLSEPQRARRLWSTYLSGLADRSMRSPEFLRLLSANLRWLCDAAGGGSPESLRQPPAT